MAPRKKRKKTAGDDDAELEQEALAEWLSRGLAAQDFTLDKMLQLWMEEDEDSEDGGDALAAKQELIQQSYNVLGPVLAQAKEFASDMRGATLAEANRLWAVAKHYAEIPPLRRQRLLREHVRDVRQMDTESEKYAFIRRRFVTEFEDRKSANAELEFGLKKRNKNRAPLLARFREMKSDADKEQIARIQADIERKRQERIDRELQEKQHAREGKEQFVADQLAYRRQMNVRFWRKQHAEAKAFSEQQVHAKEVERVFADRVELMKREMQHMEQAEIEDMKRNLDREPTSSSIGLFDTAFAPGEWNSGVDGGDRLGLDEHTIGVTSGQGYIIEHEMKRIELMEAQSKTMMLQEKLEQIMQVKAELLQDRGTIYERRDKVLEEIKYISAEYDNLGRTLAGPPRRDPSEEDKMQFHVLVSRKAAQMKQLAVLDARLENIRKREKIVERSEQSFVPLLSEVQEKEARLQEAVDQFEEHRHDLPMVIGRGIFKHGVDGDDEHAGMTVEGDAGATVTELITDPNTLLAQVTLQSKLELLKNAAIPVHEHYKTAKRLSPDTWKWNEHKVIAQQELEVTKTRLADVRDRFVEQHKASLRADLVQAIHRYHQGGDRLRKCIFPLKGYIDWWEHRVPAKSFNVAFSEGVEGIHLEKPHTSGQIRGSFRFPKRCSYRLQLLIRLQSLDEQSDINSDVPAKDDADEASVAGRALRDLKFYIGSDFDALKEHTFRDLGGKVLRTGSLSFDYFGNRICYCFEFSLRSELAGREKLQYVVSHVANYEERIEDFRDEEQRMRLQQQEKHFTSELVKTIRLQSKQTSSERCTDLLKELIVVDKSRAKTWDSKLLHGHEQRFNRSEYSKMLRVEIKKEVARQIDQDVSMRKARYLDAQDIAQAGHRDIQSRVDVSRINFLARKFALVEPQLLKAKEGLGDYCSFKITESNSLAFRSTVAAATGVQTSSMGAYQNESIIVGLRFEWREAKSKLYVMHKASIHDILALILCTSLLSPSKIESERPQITRFDHGEVAANAVDMWCFIDNANAVFLASAFAKAIKLKREENLKARTLEQKKVEQIRILQSETKKTVLEEQEAVQRELNEDKLLLKQKTEDLARRKIKLHWDAIRLTTYNESVSAQIDFQVQRRVNALAQEEGNGASKSLVTAIANDVKETFAKEFVEGRLALVGKTWERKEKRIADKREKERREREFRVRQESKIAEEIAAENKRELSELQAASERNANLKLQIPSFQSAVQGQFPCEHREVKSWGTKYDTGIRCKQCGKEMSKSFDDLNHMRGADPELDIDVGIQRGHDSGGPALQFKGSAYLLKVENERVRLEKEARAIQLTDAVLYDRMNPKAIDEFNYRHGLDRGLPPVVAGSDPLYPRIVHEAHRASFQDTVLFHGRLRNFHFRIQQLNELHAHFTTMLAVQRDFLENVNIENDFMAEKLPLVERDHARAVRLLEEDAEALRRLNKAKKALAVAQKERAIASHAIEGVEEEAEFAEFHVPALIKNSDEMQAIFERLQSQHCAIEQKIVEVNKKLGYANDLKAKTDGLLSRLLLRTSGTIVRTAFGFTKLLYFREEDDCVVLSPLRWSGTFFFPAVKVVAYEEVFREEERVAMAFEESEQRRFYEAEKRMEKRELEQMRVEESTVRKITKWRKKQELEEAAVHRSLEDKELALQLQYELTERKTNVKAAAKEAKRLSAFARVSLKRRQNGARVLPSQLDVIRVTRACEKRLAMASIESALTKADFDMRGKFVRERDAMLASELAAEIFDELLAEITCEISSITVDEGVYTSKEFLRSLSSTVVPYDENWRTVFVHTYLGFDRVWTSRKKKYEIMQVTWQKEELKLGLLKKEMARREEIRRLKEEERIRLENLRKEMLAEERLCRQFYIDEMVLCMQERKGMARAEQEMREYLRQLELEAMKTKYAKMVEDRSHTNDKAARRLEIKHGKNEKHRLHREWAHMKQEDELASQMQEQELALAQAEALERQFDRYLIQQAINGKVAAALEASRLQERICEANRLAAEQRAAFETKLTQERMVATVTTFDALATAEVKWMDAVERAAYWLRKLAPLANNLQTLKPELERIMEEREHVVADAKLRREHARSCQERLRNATIVLEQAIKHEDECSKAYKKVHFLNATMDSEVIHGRAQRFKTEYLRGQLHDRYFLMLTESIIRRAIVECSKREVARLEEKLRQLHEERITKSTEVSRLKRKHRRAFHFSLRRAELGKLMFGGSQRRLLKEKFQQWAKLWSQRVMVRASFELKHSLLLQQQKIRSATTAPAKVLQDELGVTKLSTMHDHQKRRVQCRLCKREYSEGQNNRYACSYHPAAYELACVRSCLSRRTEGGAVGTVSAACMMHRAKRWLCCDSTEEGRYGNNGCARRFHMPIRTNPELEQLVAKKTQQEEALLEQIDQQLLELSERNIVGNMKAGTKAVVIKIERDLAEKRSIAAKFHTLDRR